METQLLWMLFIQLIVIVLVAISILVFMLKKLAGRTRIPSDGSKSILITAADTLLGIQIAKHLASLGFRVFAGVSDVNSRATLQLRSSGSPWLHVLPLDVTNDVSLTSTVRAVREHFHAGEKGLWAVIHLAGKGVPTGRTEEDGDDEQQLRTALEVTVVGMLRLIRACLPHLAAVNGRLIILGADDEMSVGLRVWGNGHLNFSHGVWTAARCAAEGLASGLRSQLKLHGISVISLHPDAYYAQRINDFSFFTTSPKIPDQSIIPTISILDESPQSQSSKVLGLDNPIQGLLSDYAMTAVEDAVLSTIPDDTYLLTPSFTTRITNMFLDVSPTCVSNSMLKKHKLAQTNNYGFAV